MKLVQLLLSFCLRSCNCLFGSNDGVVIVVWANDRLDGVQDFPDG
jgi:hypothetical protein